MSMSVTRRGHMGGVGQMRVCSACGTIAPINAGMVMLVRHQRVLSSVESLCAANY